MSEKNLEIPNSVPNKNIPENIPDEKRIGDLFFNSSSECNEAELDRLTEEIFKMQEECADHVIVLKRETIKDFLKNGYFILGKSDLGENLEYSMYCQPIIGNLKKYDSDQLYKIGGLSVADYESKNFSSARRVVDLLKTVVAKHIYEDHPLQQK